MQRFLLPILICVTIFCANCGLSNKGRHSDGEQVIAAPRSGDSIETTFGDIQGGCADFISRAELGRFLSRDQVTETYETLLNIDTVDGDHIFFYKVQDTTDPHAAVQELHLASREHVAVILLCPRDPVPKILLNSCVELGTYYWGISGSVQSCDSVRVSTILMITGSTCTERKWVMLR